MARSALYTRAMRSKIRRPIRAVLLALPALAAAAAPGRAQSRDARIPEPGRLWVELTPTLLDWSDQFARNSSDSSVADGDREPVFSDLDGPIANRLFPGPDVFISDLNQNAAALGFDPVTKTDFSLGSMDFSTLNAQVRRLALGFEIGVVDRLAVGVRAPFTLTDVETSFTYDGSSATVTSAARAFPAGGAFLTDSRAGLAALQTLIAGGTLTGGALTDALSLRDEADAFLMAVEQLSMGDGWIPTGSSAAGTQIASRFGTFVSDFEALGITLPALSLPETADRADLTQLFESPPISAFTPGSVDNALSLGEVELSMRFGLIDQITPPRFVETIAGAEEAMGAADSAARATAADPGARLVAPLQDSGTERPPIRFRTSVGAMLRVPIRSASFPPFQNAAHFLDVPIGDGQTDIELALYQDIALGDWMMIRGSARYGIQRADEVILRVAPPDRPFALSSLQTVVGRDLGDYLLLLLRPSLRLNPVMSVGLEYDFFRLGEASYTLTEALPGVADATPLAIESAQTRHRIGIGFIFDLTEGQGREALVAGERSVRTPWQFGISIRRAVAGSGGRTPASFRFGADFRIPIRVF